MSQGVLKEKRNRIMVFVILIIIAMLAVLFFVLNSKQPKEAPVLPVGEPGDFEKQNFPYLDKSLSTDERVSDLLGRMTLVEKIGQLALVEKNSLVDPLDIARYNLGALMSGAGAKPEPNTAEAWLKMVNGFQSASKRSRLGIPILYGVDANHGHSNVPGAVIFPHFIGLGASGDDDLVRRVAQATAEEMRATNIFWGFTPNLDVVEDLRWGRVYETFGADSKLVARLGQAYLRGLQDSQNGSFVMGALKHYLGTGAMAWGSSSNKDFKIDQGETKIGEVILRQIHLAPFKSAIKNGAMSVMVGLNSWQGKKLSANHYLLTEVLKGELNFQGFVVSDWYGVYEISRSKYDSLVMAINAGVDLVMLPFEYQSFMIDMEQAIMNGDISLTRLDDAVARILRAKFQLGLFDYDWSKSVDLSMIGSEKHRAIAREAVRKSLVLLKNENNILPLGKNIKHIAVAGSAADNLGRQFGGWTVEWQGIDGNWIFGTTILSGIKSAASYSRVDYNERGDFNFGSNKADIGIAVVGEKPYAEGWGDEDSPSLSEEDLTAIENLRLVCQQLVVIIISGRPLNIKKYTGQWDALVAAWLPGSEGDGVAQVLFGDFPFSGQLPLAWEINY